MDPILQQQIKEYLINNLSITLDDTPDPYGLNPDQQTITLLLEGDVLGQVILNEFTPGPMGGNCQ
jgi:hypothetical protein